MFTQFALDLRLARKVAGLTQDDCATLMNRSRKYVLRLEKGAREPSLDDLLRLSVIYNRTFETYFAERLKSARATVRAGLPQLPVTISNHAAFRQRQHTLDRIEHDLLAETDEYDD
jgi:transcriptional regulator with XRE-family HTH domain